MLFMADARHFQLGNFQSEFPSLFQSFIYGIFIITDARIWHRGRHQASCEWDFVVARLEHERTGVPSVTSA
jgi:hypothetical protein